MSDLHKLEENESASTPFSYGHISESIDSGSSVMLTREQLVEQETREKRAQKIYE